MIIQATDLQDAQDLTVVSVQVPRLTRRAAQQ